jgi:hypothetical protein
MSEQSNGKVTATCCSFIQEELVMERRGKDERSDRRGV